MNFILCLWFYIRIVLPKVFAQERISKMEKLLQKEEKLAKSMHQNMNFHLPKHKLLLNKTFTDIWVSQFHLLVYKRIKLTLNRDLNMIGQIQKMDGPMKNALI